MRGREIQNGMIIQDYTIIILLSAYMVWDNRAAILGYCLFCISDFLIAVRDFYTTFPYDDILVLTFYFAAQWVLIRGHDNVCQPDIPAGVPVVIQT